MTATLKQQVENVMKVSSANAFIVTHDGGETAWDYTLKIITNLLALNKQMAEALERIRQLASDIDAHDIWNEAYDTLASYHQHGFGE